jgi:predicted nucleotidyltransferase component of viral defense system
MINTDSFSKEWIESFRKQKEYAKISPGHLEKMVHALSLIEWLVLEGFDFVFKGGTCLILLLEEASRFSIDVDIITSISREQLEKHLDNIIEESHFTKWELDKERSFKNKFPKAHYYLSFESKYTSEASYILLDVVFDISPYTETKKVKIQSKWIKTGEPIIEVKAPTIDAILGDKLTAFAPNTIGIPYQKGKDIEIVKQLFDVYHLMDYSVNSDDVSKNFESVADKQIAYQEKKIKNQDALKDTINTSLILAKRDKNTGDNKAKFDEIQGGLKKFKNQLMTGNFNIEQAQVAAARAAYISNKLINKDYSKIEKYSKDTVLDNFIIENPDLGFLQRFKKTNPEAFFYWYNCLKVGNIAD